MASEGGKKPFHKFHNRKGFRGFGTNHVMTQDSKTKLKQFVAQERLSENEVGITEYLSTGQGFSAIIKARFSDFHVNEIDLTGNIAKLTNTSEPEDFKLVVLEEERNLELISEETWEKIDDMLKSEEAEPVEIDVTTKTKEERTKMHEHLKNIYGQQVNADTKVVGENKFIKIEKFSKENKERRSQMRWPQNCGEYVHFIVYKEMLDTSAACFKISDCLKMKPSNFTYAGNKDRRAKTSQWFCIRKVDPKHILHRTRILRNVHIGNFTFKDEPLKLGHLKGNRFRIALRNVTAEDSLIDEALNSLKSTGFINYYGLQRFGNDKDVPTFDIGIKLLQGKWKEACNLILKVKPSDLPSSDVTQAKRVYESSKNAKLALEVLSKSHNKCVESKLLQGFVKNDDRDCVNALENIPRNMRLLYIHSLQSLIWNKIVSRRIKAFGLKPIVGDLVLLSAEEEVDVSIDSETEEDKSEELKDKRQNVKILTEDDIGNYSIFDIVLPLPGYDIEYPGNEVKGWYKEVLEEYNLTLEMPKQKVKTYTLSGAYRKIVGQVHNLSWKIMKYNHPNDNLIRSDYEEMKGNPEPQADPNGQYKALIIDMCLNSCHYATMVLREILKIDTSSTAHAKLNSYHDPKPAEENSGEPHSLLNNSAKYEEFKQLIFGDCTEEDGSLKRKNENEGEENVKKPKLDEAEGLLSAESSLI